jgi:hypothetical protein
MLKQMRKLAENDMLDSEIRKDTYNDDIKVEAGKGFRKRTIKAVKKQSLLMDGEHE